MISLLLSLFFLHQSTPVPMKGATITGVLKTEAGTPAAGVRVAAAPVPDSAQSTLTLVRLAETGSDGQFILDDLPPGPYYILAGRVDAPTFYPGTLDLAKGKAIKITETGIVSKIDFQVDESSLRPPANAASIPLATEASLLVTVEGADKLPSIPGRASVISFTSVSGGKDLEMPLRSGNLGIPVTNGVPGEYRVSVKNLPEGFVVKSMTFNGGDILSTTLKASLSDILASSNFPRIVTFGGAGTLQDIVDRAMQRAAGSGGLVVVIGRQ